VLKANRTFFAVPWVVTGSVAVFPIQYKGKVPEEGGLIQIEDSAAVDFAFSPFQEDLLVTGHQEGEVALWSVPQGGTPNMPKGAPALSVMKSHTKRVVSVDFHPLAKNVLITSDAGKDVKVWDLDAGQATLTLPQAHKAQVSSVSWNRDGSLMTTAAKDKFVRIFDPRSNSLVAEAADHQGAKAGRAVWLTKLDKIFTCGFTKSTQHELFLFDPRNFSKPTHTLLAEASTSSLMPFYDEDNSIMWLAGKGDSTIKSYEIGGEPMFFELMPFKAKEPQAGMAALPKVCCDVMNCEIMRLLKLTPQGVLIPLKFQVPRRNFDHFQDDLFPPSFDGQPTMNSDEWFAGNNREPGLMSLDPAKRQ